MLAAGPAALYKFLPELSSAYPDTLAFVADSSHRQRYIILGVVLGGLVLLAALGDNPIARFAGWKPVRAFGIVSYSLYLSHGIALHLTEAAGERLALAEHRSLALGVTVFLASFALSTLLGLALFLVVELPASLRKRLVY